MENWFCPSHRALKLKRGVLIFFSLGFFWGLLCFYYELQTSRAIDDVFIDGSDGEKLSIVLPESCNKPFYSRTYFSMRGTWEFSGNGGRLSCESPPLIDLLSIAPAAKRARSEYLINEEYRLVADDGVFKTYRRGWQGRESHEVVLFAANDGNLIYVGYMISDPSNHLVFRRLDEKFELTYGLHHQTGSRMQMAENDRKILAYARSISRRLK